MRLKPSLLIAVGAGALSVAALAQDRPQSILPPGFGQAPPPAAPTPSPAPAPSPDPAPAPAQSARPVDDVVQTTDKLSAAEEALAKAATDFVQPETTSSSKRDPQDAGVLDGTQLALSERPWGNASGKSLQTLMRNMDTPLASRWMHIVLRNTLMVQGRAPGDVDPADWAAERSWLLLRMGEANAARLMTASLDTDAYTPKMVQVASEVALANGDIAGLCPLDGKLDKVQKDIAPAVTAMCAALKGESERAAADIEQARRRGSMDGIDLALADKVVGATADTARAVTIEWEPVESLNAWRFGLSSATGLMPPQRLWDRAPLQLQAWMASSPIYPAEARLKAARIAASLGVFSSDSYSELMAAAYDSADPDTLPSSDMLKLRQAFVGEDLDDRLDAMRALWGEGDDRQPGRILTARAALRVVPDADLGKDAVDLIAALLAAGFDRQAARWNGVVGDIGDDAAADRAWAMLALGASTTSGLDLGKGRIETFADNDQSEERQRTKLLVAGLYGIGRIDRDTFASLDKDYDLGLTRQSGWSRMVDGAATSARPGAAVVLAASGLQAPAFARLPAMYQLHAVSALRRGGLDFAARMVAAEAIARTS